MSTALFAIGPLTGELVYPVEMMIPHNFRLFMRDMDLEKVNIDYRYEIMLVDDLPEIQGEMIAERDDIVIFRLSEETEGDYLEGRLIGSRGIGLFYAVYKEDSSSHASIYLLREHLDHLKYDTTFNSLFALERRMYSHGGMVLHCAYMDHGGQAVLFSAPSGTGKSTQAELWEKYRGCRTINGDRALLCAGDKWSVGGWPVCGSSEICNDITMPVKAIVMLSQAKENSIRRLRPMEAFRLIYSQVTINNWNPLFVNRAISEIEHLVTNIPVYHLACDISEGAVLCLENVIGKLG